MLLVDSSVLIAAARSSERLHEQAVKALEARAADHLVVPTSILSETMGFLGRRLGVHQQRNFWDGFLDSGIELVTVDRELIESARDIDRRYEDAGFGFVDCTLLAACERLRCSQVLSFDRRLAAYRPSFASGLEVLP